MLTKYGNTMSLIDATYKTTLYDVPLFFIAVKTNAGYVVAAEFIVQSEANQYIEEAINVLKVWNPEWNPIYFMCDYSDAEILALESTFPTTTVYLCDFNREQAWERWVNPLPTNDAYMRHELPYTIRFYMGVILGVNTLHRLFCFFQQNTDRPRMKAHSCWTFSVTVHGLHLVNLVTKNS